MNYTINIAVSSVQFKKIYFIVKKYWHYPSDGSV